MESDIIRFLSEALSADVQSIFTNQTSLVRTDSARDFDQKGCSEYTLFLGHGRKEESEAKKRQCTIGEILCRTCEAGRSIPKRVPYCVFPTIQCRQKIVAVDQVSMCHILDDRCDFFFFISPMG